MRGCSCRGTAGFAHVSCLAEQAKILCAEAEENNLGDKVKTASWARWYSCSLCEQHYHGVVRCALGWACWKTYLGRPEVDRCRCLAMTELGNGLSAADHHEDALVRARGRVGYAAAPWRIRIRHASRADMSCELACEAWTKRTGRKYASRCLLWKFEAQWRGTSEYPPSSPQLRGCPCCLSASKKPRSLLRKRCPWRGAFSARIMKTRSG